MKKNIRRVFWLYFLLFLMVVLYLGKFILIDRQSIINSTYNPRLNRNNYNIKRGTIYDYNKNILIESILEDDLYKRVYTGGSEFAHTAGFVHSTKSGAEAKFNFSLSNLDMEVFQRIRNLIDGEPLKGGNVRLTIDAELQREAAGYLKGMKGGLAAIEPKTGRLIALVSSPGFQPDNIGENWESLINDNEDTPLLNRASQGLYPPGSIFKVITADAIMNNMEDYESFYYQCKGIAYFGDNHIQCYDAKAHGTLNLAEALKVSCNTYFATAIQEIGYDKLSESAANALFNNNYPFELERVASRFSESATSGEIIQTAIGQGKTLVTPLHMAMISGAIANGGVMMQPYICEEITTYWGMTKQQAIPKAIGEVFSEQNAEAISAMMVKVVEGGTGAPAQIKDIAVAGKTGTAQNASDEDHGWFMAFAPAEDPQIAIALVTENAKGTKKAMEIVKKLLESYLTRGIIGED